MTNTTRSELQNYLDQLDNLRAQIRALVADLPAEALNWQPLPESDEPTMNTLAVLAAHSVGSEHFWIAEGIGGYPPTRDRDAEFRFVADGPDELLRRIDAIAVETHEVLGRLSDADLGDTRTVRGKVVTVRWGMAHMVEHYAMHLGHMQITYQLWTGGRAAQWPRWHERLPGS